MLVVHFSEDDDFMPEEMESVDGYEGCWFYESPDNIYDIQEMSKAWGGRTPHFFEIDEKYITEEQDMGTVIEYFVDAENLNELRRVDPEFSYEL